MRVELGVWQLDAAVLRREPQDGVELALADGALDQAIEKLAVLGSCALPQVAGGHVDDHLAREFGPLYQAFELVGLAAELGETGIKSGNAIGRTGFSQSRFSLAAAVAAGQTSSATAGMSLCRSDKSEVLVSFRLPQEFTCLSAGPAHPRMPSRNSL